MAIKVGINGFGRIGRNIMRAAMAHDDIDIVAVNDLTDAATLAHLLKYDSILGNLKADIQATGDRITRRRRRVPGARARRTRPQLPWKDLGVDVVFECTGRFTKRDDAAKHIAAGAKRVDHHGAGQEAGRDGRHGRQPRGVRPGEAPDHLERVVHDQLPRAGREGAARVVRHREGLDDDGPRLHERPAICSTCRTRTCAARARRRCR